MPRHNWTLIRQHWDRMIADSEDGQTVTLYHPARTVSSGVPVESVPVLAGTTSALILQGGDEAQAATLAGLDPNQSAVAYFLSTALSLVTAGAFLLDAGGAWWRLHSKPDVQRAAAGGTIIGVSALLVLQSAKPSGIP